MRSVEGPGAMVSAATDMPGTVPEAEPSPFSSAIPEACNLLSRPPPECCPTNPGSALLALSRLPLELQDCCKFYLYCFH